MTQSVFVVGLGPAGLDRLTPAAHERLTNPEYLVVLRTAMHPAARELAGSRHVETCDDLYEDAVDFDAVYTAIVARVLEMAATEPVVYAVPGSAMVGERAVTMLLHRAAEAGIAVDVIPGESFLDLVWVRTGCDPIANGAQILDGRDLPDPLQLHVPTVITQVDRSEVLADVVIELGRVLEPETAITLLDSLGASDERVVKTTLGEVNASSVGPRTSLFIDPPANGWVGLVATNRLLRELCPWDKKQTHHTLLKHLIEETYETVAAIEQLAPEAPHGDVDFGAYAEVEEELGDLLLQVVFHATLAEEPGAFGAEEVAESIRRKLVLRHPHVFGDVDARDADTVSRNWEALKTAEKGRTSVMDDVPSAMPALVRAEKLQRRAASVGFDWPSVSPVIAKVHEELQELDLALGTDVAADIDHEVGDVLFTVVNLARHATVDAELAFRRANARFERRFRAVERLAAARTLDLRELSLEDLDALWEDVKTAANRLAVYGSLAPGATNHDIVSHIPGEWWSATIRGHVHNHDWHVTGGYPSFEIADDGGAVSVTVLESSDLPLHWERLDLFEGAGYDRVVTDAVRDDGSHVAVSVYSHAGS